MDGDVIDDILQEEFDYVSLGDQMFNHVDKGITEMGLDIMALTSALLPQDLTIDDIFHGVVQEQVHIGTSFIEDIGRNTLRDVDEEHVSFHLEKRW